MIVLERVARHVLHHDEEDAVLLLRGRDGDDVGMIDAGEEARLAEQLAEVEVLPVRDLDRDLFVDPGVLGEIHGAEPAAAERGEDLVLAEDLSLEQHPGEYTGTEAAGTGATRKAQDTSR